MSLGKLVIATGYSANTEFMSAGERVHGLASARCRPGRMRALSNDGTLGRPGRRRGRPQSCVDSMSIRRRLARRASRRDAISRRIFPLEARADVFTRRWVDLRHRCTEKRMKTIPWFHRIEVAPGVWTPGMQAATHKTLTDVRMPEDLTGRTVLDVGAWDGFYLVRGRAPRGGSRPGNRTPLSLGRRGGLGHQGRVPVCPRCPASREWKDLDIDRMEIPPDTVGTWDVVLFLGVLYHLKNPLEALERMASVTNELLIVETLVDTRAGEERPLLTFYPGAELHGDPTNWFGPNVRCRHSHAPGSPASRESMCLNVEPVKPHLNGSRWHSALATLENPNGLSRGARTSGGGTGESPGGIGPGATFHARFENPLAGDCAAV